MTGPEPTASPGARAGERLLTEMRGEIARADSKAAVLVAALGVTAGLFSGLLAGRKWDPGTLSAPGSTLWWAGVAAHAVSLFALLLAVLPRYRFGAWAPGRPLCYFGDVQQAARAGRLAEALAETERDPTAGLTAALAQASRIAVRKHQWIRVGLTAFSIGTVLLPAALLVG
ncbi:Pycsar system effector family protein [Streptomyces thermoalcalitolerans]|uniref:Pycsar effector protein domain-containing protein n=1 Tax=Streptomyces thermoalcalitolerans TaxID=65605 RepID=A0ABN1NW23_9ACTN